MADNYETERWQAKIEGDVEHMKDMQRFIVSANPDYRKHAEEVLQEREGSANLYLALAAKPLTQPELAEYLGMSQPNVSRICNHLLKIGFIKRIPSNKGDRHNAYTWGRDGRFIASIQSCTTTCRKMSIKGVKV